MEAERCGGGVVTDLELLRSTRAVLAPKGRWIKGAFARDRVGDEASPCDSRAQCWCLIGAALKVGPPGCADRFAVLLGFDDNSRAVEWNDEARRTHAEVIGRIDAAIAGEAEA